MQCPERLGATPLTPPAPGGIGCVAIWGAEAGAFMRSLVPGLAAGSPRYRRLRVAGEVVDEVIALLIGAEEAPTGAEEGEISFHGGRVAQDAALAFLEGRGAAIRSFEEYLDAAARLDLVQREAIRALPRATTERQVAFLARQRAGELSAAIESLRGSPDLGESLRGLLRQARVGSMLARGARVLVVGPPNAGKSTLVNRLSGLARSIVTDVPGTTRDVLEAAGEIDGFPVTYLDSGGIARAGSEIERLAAERALAAIPEAGAILCLGIEPCRIGVPEDRAIRVGPKADLGEAPPPGALPVSGLTGLGIEALKAMLLDKLTGGGDWTRPAPFTDRQIAGLARALAAVEERGVEAALQAARLVVR